MEQSSEVTRSAADHARLLIPPAVVIAGLVVGFVSSLLFGAFDNLAVLPGHPRVGGYPEPIELTWEKLCRGAFVGERSALRRRPERPNPSD